MLLTKKGVDMAKDREVSHVVFAEKLLNRTALGVLIVSFAFVFDIAATYAEEGRQTFFDIVSYALSGLVILIILPIFLSYVRHFRGEGDLVDSFVLQSFRTGCVRAFEVTFVSLIFLDLVISKFYPKILAQVVVEGVLALSLSVMSLTFFILNLKDGRNDLGDDDWGEDDPS
jgi:hypothetical protein